MTAVAILAGLQMLTCGADPLPPVRRLVVELDRKASGSAVEKTIRLLVFGAVLGLVLARAGA